MEISILKDVLLCIVTSCFAFLISEEKIAMRLFMYALVLLASENIFSVCSYRKKDDHVNLKHAWDAVKEKLLDSLDAIERRSNLGNKFLQFEQQHAKRPLSLFAISDSPKLQLLWTSFQWLEEEAGTATTVSSFYNCPLADKGIAFA